MLAHEEIDIVVQAAKEMSKRYRYLSYFPSSSLLPLCIIEEMRGEILSQEEEDQVRNIHKVAFIIHRNFIDPGIPLLSTCQPISLISTPRIRSILLSCWEESEEPPEEPFGTDNIEVLNRIVRGWEHTHILPYMNYVEGTIEMTIVDCILHQDPPKEGVLSQSDTL